MSRLLIPQSEFSPPLVPSLQVEKTSMALGILLTVLAASAVPSTLATPSYTDVLDPSIEVAAQRGPGIFNSVYDSLRKWGSIVHPNGMSLYLATVPQGVMLHHGNDRNETPTRLDWLAYEIEHAEMFARAGHPGGPGHPGHPGKHMGPSRVEEGLKRRDEAQVRLVEADIDSVEDKHGWLHTYQTTRPLHFLYIDGMSGDKGGSGVLDTQEYLLRGMQDDWRESRAEKIFDGKPPGPPGEFDRALDLCHLCAEWQLEGVIRTEGAGFEIVMCNFSQGMQQLQSVRRADSQGFHPSYRGPSLEGPGHPRFANNRLRDIGSGRTILDYSSMVSAFFFPVNLTNPDSNRTDLPRLTSTTAAEMTAIREYLAKVIKSRLDQPLSDFTWRDIADLIVRRYGTEISSMANGTDSTEQLASRVRFLLEVFTDYSVVDKELRDAEARKRCSTFYIQTMPLNSEADRLIYAGFEAVNTEICTALFSIRDLLASDADAEHTTVSLREVKDILKSLMEYLSWNDYAEKDSQGRRSRH